MPFDDKIAYVQNYVKKMISVMVDATLLFYEIDDIVKPNSLTKELFTNLITNFIIEGELYFLIYNITSAQLEPIQQNLRKIMMSQEILENVIPITSLGLKKQFQFDVNHRTTFTNTKLKTLNE